MLTIICCVIRILHIHIPMPHPARSPTHPSKPSTLRCCNGRSIGQDGKACQSAPVSSLTCTAPIEALAHVLESAGTASAEKMGRWHMC